MNLSSENNQIFITGVAGIFPNSKNVEEFRALLDEKQQLLNSADPDWKILYPDSPRLVGKQPLNGKFDAGFFGVCYKHAEEMHEGCRKVLEVSVEAVIDSGTNPLDLKGSRTGVFVVSNEIESKNEWTMRKLTSPNFSVLGVTNSLLAAKIGYHLQLEGPTVTVDSLCASSFSALNLAAKYMLRGTCDNALVCGLNTVENPNIAFGFQQLGALNLDENIHVFDESSSGYIKSEATVVVFLQKLQNAKRIYAEILNVKTNNDGYKSTGILYPSNNLIAEVYQDVYEEIDIDPSTVYFVESHITGTKAGIIEEVIAIEKAFCSRRKTSLPIGSVKSNVGHCEAASGLISLIKIFLGLQHNCIFPNPDYQKLNPEVDAFQSGKIVVPTKHIQLPSDQDVIIGCNSAGFGGTNAHVVLKHHNKTLFVHNQIYSNRLVFFSARTMPSLKKIADSFSSNVTKEYLNLVQNVFNRNIPENWYRGYVVMTNGIILEKCLQYCDEKKKLCLIFPQGTEDWLSYSKFINKIPIASKSITRVQDICLANEIDILRLWNGKNELEFGDVIIGAVALQMVIIDVLQELVQNEILLFDGTSSGMISAAYGKKELSLDEALFVVIQLRKRLNKTKNNTELEDNRKTRIIKEEIENYYKKSATNFTKSLIKVVVGNGTVNELCLQSNTGFEHVLGCLYTAGIDLNLDKLYQNEFWPVKTSLISPLIQWKHEHDWPVFKYTLKHLNTLIVRIALNSNEWNFLSGHVIDGNNLLPGSAYLVVAWNCYLKLNHLAKENTNIIFENVKFHKMTILSKQKPVVLTIDFTRVQNKFEIREGNECLVTGSITSFSESFDFTINHQEIPVILSKEVLSTKDIYKKYNLHGYNYNDAFCCLQKASLDGTTSIIKWNNWTTFLDGMNQLMVLSKKLDDMYIPLGIKRIVIDTKTHTEALTKYNQLLPVYFDNNSNVLSAPGVEICEILLANISKRTENEPTLETYNFVPFDTNLSLEDSVTVAAQLLTENFGNTLKVIEIVDSFSDDSFQLLCPLLKNVVNLKPTLSIFGKNLQENFNIEVVARTIDQLPADTNLIILSQGSSRIKKVTEILQHYDVFILSREADSYEAFNSLNIISVFRTNLECLVLLRNYSSIVKRFIEVRTDMVWLKELHSALEDNKKVVLIDQNDATSGIIGLVNCLKKEVGQNISCMYLLNSDKQFDITDEFFQKQLQKNLTINVLKNGKWGSYRHLPLSVERKNCFQAICAINGSDLSHLEYLEGPITKGVSLNQESLVEIKYAGVNFKDVMVSTGKVNFNYLREYRSRLLRLGCEFAGTDLRRRRLMGITPHSGFSNFVSLDKAIVCDVPKYWSLEDAATVFLSYTTALHALLQICRLKRGQSVLVHSGTGGVGLSTINICLHFNCNIFVTVGSKEKQNYLKTLYPTLADSHIGNSRDTTFEHMILKQTGGRGVDIIINSLSGDKLQANTRCLAPRGIVVELTKYDSQMNNLLPFNMFADGRVYVSAHMDMLQLNDKKQLNQLIPLLKLGIKDGYVKPLPRVVYDKDNIEDALRFMSLGKHTGKILIKFKDEFARIQMAIQARSRFFCDDQKVYVLVGGLGGFGIELIDWLIGRGAQKLLLISRSGATSGYQKFKLLHWQKLGCKVLVLKDDLTHEKRCTDLLLKANSMGIVDGIFNLSAVIHDSLFEKQTEETFQAALAPKALITRNLDMSSRKLCPNLRKFVVFSSYSSGRGSLGQTNYGMANSVAERICEQRQSQGYPALAIQWSFIREVGLMVEKQSTAQVNDGILGQSIQSCLNVMDTFLTQEQVVVVSSTLFEIEKNKYYSKSDNFLNTIAEILAISNMEHVSVHSTLTDLGMDSTSTVQLRHFLETECNMYFTASELRSMVLYKLIQMNDDIVH